MGNLRDCLQLLELTRDEVRIDLAAVAWDNGPGAMVEHRAQCLRPLERVGIREEGRSTFFDQIPNESGRGIGNDDNDIRVRVPPSEMQELD